MNLHAQAHPGEATTSPDPLALAKRVGKKSWPYATGLIGIIVALGIVFRHSQSWGDVATWIVAITTLLAFLTAAFAGLVAYDLLKVENARDLKAAEERLLAADDRRRAEEDRAAQRRSDQRAQASRVTAWFEQYHDDQYELIDKVWGAAVRNASELPIF